MHRPLRDLLLNRVDILSSTVEREKQIQLFVDLVRNQRLEHNCVLEGRNFDPQPRHFSMRCHLLTLNAMWVVDETQIFFYDGLDDESLMVELCVRYYGRTKQQSNKANDVEFIHFFSLSGDIVEGPVSVFVAS